MATDRPFDQALAAYQAGQLEEALELCTAMLRTEPRSVQTLQLMGRIACDCGQPDWAAPFFESIVKLEPDSATARHQLGLVQARLGQWTAAETSQECALVLQPTFAAAHYQLGLARRELGDLRGALAAWDNAIRHQPDYPAVYEAARGVQQTYLAQAAQRLAENQPLEALAEVEKALEITPEDASCHALAGDALHALGNLTIAVTAYERAVGVDASQTGAWWGLGCVRLKREEYASAAKCLRKAVELSPQAGQAWHNLGTVLHELGQADEARAAMGRALELLGPDPTVLGALATIIPECPGADPTEIREVRQTWARHCAPAKEPLQRRSLDAGRQPLRLGYVSSFFQSRNWMKPVWGLINHHDRQRFQIHLFSDAPAEKVQGGYEPQPSDQYHDISGLSNEEAARRITAAEIDILIDLNGYSKLARLPLLAHRSAPVQVAWFNMYATTGMAVFDALLADAQVFLPGEEVCYAEKVTCLPGCYLTFEVRYPVPDVTPPPCLAGQPFTFGCLAPLYKLTPPTLDAFARILNGVPGSRLFLKGAAFAQEDNRKYLLDQFHHRAIPPERLLLEGPAEHYAFLERYAAVDLALDTFPYNGGTTTMEALWQGVPVLCFRGDRWVSRISASLMHHADLEEFIAPDVEGFVQKAITLANDPGTSERLAELRQTMRERLRQSPVCDVQGFARSMEREYERLWRERCQAVMD